MARPARSLAYTVGTVVSVGVHMVLLGVLALQKPVPPTPPAHVVAVELVRLPKLPAVSLTAAKEGGSSAPRLISAQRKLDDEEGAAFTGAQGVGEAAEGSGGDLSPWRVAPSRVYQPERTGEALDCSLSNDEGVWRRRSEHCRPDPEPDLQA